MARPDLIAGDGSAARDQTPLAFQKAFAARWATAAADRTIRTLEGRRRNAACPATECVRGAPHLPRREPRPPAGQRIGHHETAITASTRRLQPDRRPVRGHRNTDLDRRLPLREPLRGDHAPAGAPHPCGHGIPGNSAGYVRPSLVRPAPCTFRQGRKERTEYENSCASGRGLAGSAA
ncbi:DUF6207 family protein [Streptomyces sp. NPDC007856]|uniref:DUF6207 family protein n=1 Tax=Streptomyces sp. NPDC007856 TaxID=3364781 RepID=UPI003698D057